MTNVEDDKEFKEEANVQVLSKDENTEVKETNEEGDEEEVTGDDDEDFVGEEEDEDDEEDDDDDEEEDDEEEEDLGTEYLVRPVGEAEEEDDASDFEPEENGVEEDIDEEVDEDEEAAVKDITLSAGKSEPLSKRKRVAKDHNNEQGAVTGGDDLRPSKR